jgi:hypothetical protein
MVNMQQSKAKKKPGGQPGNLNALKHRLKWTLTTAAWIDNDEAYHFEAVVDAAAASVFKIFGGIINYTLRL